MAISKPNNRAETAAIGVSVVCLLHCLALPLVFAMVPALAVWITLPDEFHIYMVTIALPLSLPVLIAGYRRHFHCLPLAFGLFGLGCLIGGLAANSYMIETMLTVTGALILAFAHSLNWRSRNLSNAPAS